MSVTLNEPQGGFGFVQPTELLSKPAGGVVAFVPSQATAIGPVIGVGKQGDPGPQGPPGPTGPPGSDPSVAFTFAVPSTTWVLTHNLGVSKVNVVTEDNSGVEIYGDVTFLSATTATVTWYYPTSGSARVSP